MPDNIASLNQLLSNLPDSRPMMGINNQTQSEYINPYLQNSDPYYDKGISPFTTPDSFERIRAGNMSTLDYTGKALWNTVIGEIGAGTVKALTDLPSTVYTITAPFRGQTMSDAQLEVGLGKFSMDVTKMLGTDKLYDYSKTKTYSSLDGSESTMGKFFDGIVKGIGSGTIGSFASSILPGLLVAKGTTLASLLPRALAGAASSGISKLNLANRAIKAAQITDKVTDSASFMQKANQAIKSSDYIGDVAGLVAGGFYGAAWESVSEAVKVLPELKKELDKKGYTPEQVNKILTETSSIMFSQNILNAIPEMIGLKGILGKAGMFGKKTGTGVLGKYGNAVADAERKLTNSKIGKIVAGAAGTEAITEYGQEINNYIAEKKARAFAGMYFDPYAGKASLANALDVDAQVAGVLGAMGGKFSSMGAKGIGEVKYNIYNDVTKRNKQIEKQNAYNDISRTLLKKQFGVSESEIKKYEDVGWSELDIEKLEKQGKSPLEIENFKHLTNLQANKQLIAAKEGGWFKGVGAAMFSETTPTKEYKEKTEKDRDEYNNARKKLKEYQSSLDAQFNKLTITKELSASSPNMVAEVEKMMTTNRAKRALSNGTFSDFMRMINQTKSILEDAQEQSSVENSTKRADIINKANETLGTQLQGIKERLPDNTDIADMTLEQMIEAGRVMATENDKGLSEEQIKLKKIATKNDENQKAISEFVESNDKLINELLEAKQTNESLVEIDPKSQLERVNKFVERAFSIRDNYSDGMAKGLKTYQLMEYSEQMSDVQELVTKINNETEKEGTLRKAFSDGLVTQENGLLSLNTKNLDNISNPAKKELQNLKKQKEEKIKQLTQANKDLGEIQDSNLPYATQEQDTMFDEEITNTANKITSSKNKKTELSTKRTEIEEQLDDLKGMSYEDYSNEVERRNEKSIQAAQKGLVEIDKQLAAAQLQYSTTNKKKRPPIQAKIEALKAEKKQLEKEVPDIIKPDTEEYYTARSTEWIAEYETELKDLSSEIETGDKELFEIEEQLKVLQGTSNNLKGIRQLEKEIDDIENKELEIGEKYKDTTGDYDHDTLQLVQKNEDMRLLNQKVMRLQELMSNKPLTEEKINEMATDYATKHFEFESAISDLKYSTVFDDVKAMIDANEPINLILERIQNIIASDGNLLHPSNYNMYVKDLLDSVNAKIESENKANEARRDAVNTQANSINNPQSIEELHTHLQEQGGLSMGLDEFTEIYNNSDSTYNMDEDGTETSTPIEEREEKDAIEDLKTHEGLGDNLIESIVTAENKTKESLNSIKDRSPIKIEPIQIDYSTFTSAINGQTYDQQSTKVKRYNESLYTQIEQIMQNVMLMDTPESIEDLKNIIKELSMYKQMKIASLKKGMPIFVAIDVPLQVANQKLQELEKLLADREAKDMMIRESYMRSVLLSVDKEIPIDKQYYKWFDSLSPAQKSEHKTKYTNEKNLQEKKFRDVISKLFPKFKLDTNLSLEEALVKFYTSKYNDAVSMIAWETNTLTNNNLLLNDFLNGFNVDVLEKISPDLKTAWEAYKSAQFNESSMQVDSNGESFVNMEKLIKVEKEYFAKTKEAPFGEQQMIIRKLVMSILNSDIAGNSKVALLYGLAGVGKSNFVMKHAMGILKEYLGNSEKVNVHGQSNTESTTAVIQDALGVKSTTETIQGDGFNIYVIDEIGKYSANDIAKLKREANTHKKRSFYIFTGDPNQIVSETNRSKGNLRLPFYLEISNKKSPFNNPTILPTMVISRRTGNASVLAFQNLFLNRSKNVFADDNISLTYNNKQGVQSLINKKDVEFEINNLKGSSILIITDKPKKYEDLSSNENVTVVSAYESQGLTSDAVFIDMDYNPIKPLEKDGKNREWYVASSRTGNKLFLVGMAGSLVTTPAEQSDVSLSEQRAQQKEEYTQYMESVIPSEKPPKKSEKLSSEQPEKKQEASSNNENQDNESQDDDFSGEGQQSNPDEKDEKAPYVNEIKRPTLSNGEVLLDFHDFEKSFKEGDVVQTILMQGTKNDKPTLLEVAFYGTENTDFIIGFREPSETNMTEEEIEKLPRFDKDDLEITPLDKLEALEEGRLFERTITKASNKRQIEWSSDEFTITDTIEKVRNAQWNPQTTAVFHGFSIDTDAKSRFKGRLKLHLLTFSVNKMFNKGSLDNKKRFVAALELLMYGTSVPNYSMLMDDIIELVENINKTTEPENALEMAKLDIVKAQVNGLVTQKRDINNKPFIQVNAPKLTENHPDVVVIKEFYETVKKINDALNNERLPFVQFGNFEEVHTASITLTTGDKTRSISYNPHRIFIEALQYMERGNKHTAFFKNLDSKKEMLGDTLETAENIKIAIEKAAEVISKDEKGKELYKQLKTTTNVQGDKIETVGEFYDASPTTENAKTRKVVEYTDVTLATEVEEFVAKHIEQGWSLVAIEGLENAYDLRKVVRINIDSNQETGTIEVVLSIPIDANYGKILQEHPVTFKIFKLGANQERSYGTLKKGKGLTGSNLIFNPASHPDILNDMYEDTQVMDSDPESIKTLLAYINTNLLQGGIRGKKQVRGAVNEAIYNMSRKNNKVKLSGIRRNNGKEIYVGLTNYLNDSVRKFDLDNVSALDFPSFTRNSYNNYDIQKDMPISPMDVLQAIINNYPTMYENIPVGATDNLYDSNLSTTNPENTERVDEFMENKSTNVQDIVESFVVLSDSTVVNPPQTQNETQTPEEISTNTEETSIPQTELSTEGTPTTPETKPKKTVAQVMQDAKKAREARKAKTSTIELLTPEERDKQFEIEQEQRLINEELEDREEQRLIDENTEDTEDIVDVVEEVEEDVVEETDSEEQVKPSSTKDATLSSSRIESTSEGSKSFKFTMSVKLTESADDSSNNAFKLIVFLEMKALIPKMKLTEEQEKQLTDKVLDYIETNKADAYNDIGLKDLKIQANQLLAEEVLKMFSEPGVINQTELNRLQKQAGIQVESSNKTYTIVSVDIKKSKSNKKLETINIVVKFKTPSSLGWNFLVNAEIPEKGVTPEQEKILVDTIEDYLKSITMIQDTNSNRDDIALEAQALLAEKVFEMFSGKGVITSKELKKLKQTAKIQRENCSPF
jgi:hypothetical protein